MKHFLILTVLLLTLALTAYSQISVDYRLLNGPPDRTGIVGNGITDLVWKNGNLYAGTGYGLSMTPDGGATWQNFTPSDYGGKGGISALAVADNGTIWIATGYDTTVQDGESLSAGGGLRYKEPGSSGWVYIRQPKDARSDTLGGMKPTTTHVQNITFDIALLDSQVWIASFGGGVRRSSDKGQTWEVITTDGHPFSSLDFLNHRGFSVMAENNNIWVGTAGGISKSEDGGQTWRRFVVPEGQIPQSGGISGNWILALAHNPWDNSVWAVTLSTGGEEFNSISRTRDGGNTWDNLLADELSDGTFARYIAFYDSVTYVATEKGVYKSIDAGASWYRFPAIVDKDNGEQLLTSTFYSVAAAPDSGRFHRVWLGSADGLASSADNGYNWTVYRSVVSTRQRTEPSVYAYPSPFSPARETQVRFQYDITSAGTVQIDIFNFAMEKVITIYENEMAPSGDTYDRSASWDGRDNNGRMVDNGVYFFRVEVEGRVEWGKLVVIN
ncbi:MAG: hypothetical protein WAN36_01170 [Calditrichia bacterium]